MTTMTVGEICRSSYPIVPQEATVQEAADRMRQREFHWLPVTFKGRIVGLVSAWDIIRRAVASGLDQEATPVEAIMTVGIPTCSEGANLGEAIQLLKRKAVPQVAVVSEGPGHTVVGILTAEDIVRAVDPERLDAEFYLRAFR
jgi:CBS domain-containing protein